MKKIGLISDVHGNYNALVAILNLFQERGCNELIHTGDVVNIGPKSKECLELLLSKENITLLLGNHDRDFARNEPALKEQSHVPEAHKRSVFDSMTQAEREIVAAFPLYAIRKLGKSKVAFCHFAFKQGVDPSVTYPFLPFVKVPTAAQLDEQFAHLDCDAVFFGHEHSPCDIQGNKLYVDVGSVGCHPEPLATGIIITYDDEQWSYERVSVPYDMEKTYAELKQTPCGAELYDYYFLRKNN